MELHLCGNGLNSAGSRAVPGPLERDVTIKFNPPIRARAGDVFMNEILSDPKPGEAQYIEFWVASNRPILVQDLFLFSDSADDTDTISLSTTSEIRWAPDSYILLTPDTASIIRSFPVRNESNFTQVDLPKIDRKSGRLILYSREHGVADIAEYHEDFHSQMLSETRGKSLERISHNTLLDGGIWGTAASQVKYGTPGMRNTQHTLSDTITEGCNISQHMLHPFPDGYYDHVILSTATKDPGNILRIKVFDMWGYEVASSIPSIPGTNAVSAVWDGRTVDGTIVHPGLYILSAHIYNPMTATTLICRAAITVAASN
jgi:hypothetical protein